VRGGDKKSPRESLRRVIFSGCAPQAPPSQPSTLDEGGKLRLFRMLVPVALLAFVVVGSAGAKSTVTPAPAFAPQVMSMNSGDDWLTVGGGLNDQRHST